MPGGMGGMAGGILGAVGGFISSREAQKQGRQWNRYVQSASNMMRPENVMPAAYMYNPFLWSALGQPGLYQDQATTMQGGQINRMGNRTEYRNTPYGQSLSRLINDPGSIDPAIMNRNMTMIDRGADRSMQQAQGMMGRSGMQGGLGQAYALANASGRTNQKAQLMQQYVLFREQQRRADIEMINQMIQASINTASQNQQAQAGFAIQKKPTVGFRGVVGNTLGGAMEGMGIGMQGQSQQTPGMNQQYQGQPVQPQWNSGSQGMTQAMANNRGVSRGNDITPENNPLSGYTPQNMPGMFNMGTSKPVSTPTSSPTVYGNRPQV